ncbi:hypothetical protein L7F22_046932 [Adiantum nelumboides]|nr:hypothetical protein [Adiantum nelumboides]
MLLGSQDPPDIESVVIFPVSTQIVPFVALAFHPHRILICIAMGKQKSDQKQKQVDISKYYKIVEGQKKRKQKKVEEEQARIMENLFGDGSEIGPDNNEDMHEVQGETSLEPASKVKKLKVKKLRRWRPCWKFQHRWVYLVVLEVMVGCKSGLFAKMKADVPHLLLVHCLAHRENLAASQAIGKRMDNFKLIEGALDVPELAMLRMHSVSKDLHTHKLTIDRIEGSIRGGLFEDCMQLGRELVANIVENLKTRMQEDVPLFDACNLFHYPDEELEKENCIKQWLEKLLKQYGSLLGDVEKCMGELDSFVTALNSNFKRKGFCDGWDVCKDDIMMHDSFSNMMRLWEILFVVPVSTTAAALNVDFLLRITSNQLIGLACP